MTRVSARRVSKGFRWTFPDIETVKLDASAIFGAFTVSKYDLIVEEMVRA